MIGGAAWFAAALGAGAAAVVATTPDTRPAAIGLAAAVPPLAALSLAIASTRFRGWAASLALRLLTTLQARRTAGLAFVAPASVGALPESSALPAGYGDIAVGVTAPLVAWFVVDRLDRLDVARTRSTSST